jgi:hypothetical protein
MLSVDENYCDSKYIDMYWKNNMIIDQSKTKINKNINLNLEDDIIKENLYKSNKSSDYKYDINKTFNNSYNKHSNNNNFQTHNTINYQNSYTSNKYDNQYSSNKTHYRSNYKKLNKDNNEYCLQSKCRIKEHYRGEKRILLDSFSKPKLLN